MDDVQVRIVRALYTDNSASASMRFAALFALFQMFITRFAPPDTGTQVTRRKLAEALSDKASGMHVTLSDVAMLAHSVGEYANAGYPLMAYACVARRGRGGGYRLTSQIADAGIVTRDWGAHTAQIMETIRMSTAPLDRMIDQAGSPVERAGLQNRRDKLQAAYAALMALNGTH